MKKGLLIKERFELTEETKKFLFFKTSWITEIENFDYYKETREASNWNYIHDKINNVVYFVTKREDNASTGVFGNIEHLKNTYQIQG